MQIDIGVGYRSVQVKRSQIYFSYKVTHTLSIFISSIIAMLIINPLLFIEYFKIIGILIVPIAIFTLIIIDQFEIIYCKIAPKNQSFISIRLYFSLFMKIVTIFIFSLPILAVAIFIFTGAIADGDGCRPFYKCTNWKDSLQWTAQVGLAMFPYLLVFALLMGYLNPVLRYQFGKPETPKQ
jgi:hypothetical protein